MKRNMDLIRDLLFFMEEAIPGEGRTYLEYMVD